MKPKSIQSEERFMAPPTWPPACHLAMILVGAGLVASGEATVDRTVDRTPEFGQNGEHPAERAEAEKPQHRSSAANHNPRVGGSSPSSGIAAASGMRRIPRSKGADLAGGWQGKWQGSNSEKPVEAAGIIDCVKPTRTDFKGYEGKYVA